MSLESTLNLAFHWNHTETDGADRETVDRNALALIKTLTDGTIADKANKIFHERRTITAGNSHTYDLAGGISDSMGNSIVLARVKALVIQSLATADAATLDVGGAAANGWISWVNAADDVVTVMAGGLLVLFAPGLAAYPVTAGTADQLKLAAVGGDVQFDIAICGSSA